MSPSSGVSSPLSDIPYGDLAEATQNNLHTWDSAIPPPAMHRHHVYPDGHSIPDDSHCGRPRDPNEALFHPRETPSTHIYLNQQTKHDLTLRWPRDMEAIPDPFPISPWPAMVNQTHGDGTLPGSHPIDDLGWHGAYLGSHATSNPRQALWPVLPGYLGCYPSPLEEPIANQFRLPVSHAAHSQYASASNNHQVIETSIQPDVPPQQPPNLPLSHSFAYPCPPPDQHIRIVQEVYSPSLSRNRDARAIEYDGLWLDEEELRKALVEADGKLTVFQCLWEHHHIPCHLWIKGDKSSINAHIQKWHGGKPGGEKLEVDCRWSSCGKKMRKESITRHILSVHLGQLWECRGCGKENTRNDAHRRHIANSDSEACQTLSALITYSADTRVVDVSTALTNGGRMRYAGA